MVEDLGAGVLYSGGRDPREQPDQLGPLFTWQGDRRALTRARAVFRQARDILRRAGLIRERPD